MTNYVGDFRPGDTVRVPFTTVNTSGQPTALAGSPAAAVYALGFASALAAGVSLAVNFGSVIGQNVAIIDTSQDTVAYAQQTDFAVTIASGTVSAVLVTGYNVGHFSLNNRSVRNTTSVAQMGVNVLTVQGLSAVSSLALGNVNVGQINGAGVVTSTAMVGVNVVTVAGAAAVSSLAAGNVNAVTIAGVAPATSALQGNVNVITIGGALAATSIAVGGSVVNQVLGQPVTTSQALFGANVVTFAGNSLGPLNIAVSTSDLIQGTTSNASSTTQVTISTIDVPLTTASQYVGRVLNFRRDTATANLRGQSTIITGGSATTGGSLTVIALTDSPAFGDTWFIS